MQIVSKGDNLQEMSKPILGFGIGDNLPEQSKPTASKKQ